MDWQAVSQLCTSCGMCCDGTLFSHATISNEADLALAASLGMTTLKKNERDAFALPCHHFTEQCTIYDQARPHTCSAFFCQPIRDIRRGKCDLADARRLISRAVKFRSQFVLASRAYPEFAGQSVFDICQQLNLQKQPPEQHVAMRKKYAPLYLIGARLFPLLNAINPGRKTKKALKTLPPDGLSV